jgi:ribitol 2-dehydrogenase
MRTELAGKVVLVTGGSSGIGRALARTLSAEGAKVALVGRSAERLQEVAASLPGEALPIAADLTRAGEVERVVAETRARFSRIDILLPNAGLYIPGDVAEGDPDAWDELLAVNVNSVFRLVRAVIGEMIERHDGQIVITSSISGHQAIQWEPVYSASKHAIQSFAHGLKRQVAPHGIRVGTVAPGRMSPTRCSSC